MNGWKWVPVEPTPRMLAAGVAAEANAPTHVQERLTLLAYRAMLNAAPPPAADAVSDAMVEAALDACAREGDEPWRQLPEAVVAMLKVDMRAAIAAALAAMGA